SRYLARSLSADETLAEWVLSHPASLGFWSGSIAESLRQPLADAADSSELYRLLRQLRRRCMCLVAWADLAGVYTLDDTMAAVSELADTLIDAALERLYADLCARFGAPIGAESGAPIRMVVLGLGKLGGGELNYSSDVDLIFCFAEGGETDGPRTLSNEEFFTRLGRKLVQLLDEPSADGFVFRTDMRLRPNGASGPLALSFDAMEHYYQAHGRDWERYALIKARVVAGDKDRGAELLATLRPFVYRKYLDFSAFESIREMKGLIDRELERKGRRQDIKLGRGGIREIEFIVQSHQLIRGGREPALQTPSLHKAFDELVRLEVVGAKDRDALMEAYAFLRNTEHRLQMVDDMQTQKLPSDEGERERLATAMGFDGWGRYEEALQRRRDLVQSHFTRLFQTDQRERPAELDTYIDVWFGTRSDAVCGQFLEEQGFADPLHALELIRGIRKGRVYQSFSRNGRERLDRMIPPALREIAAGRSPDQSLVRFISVVEGIGRRSAYFALLAENPLALKQLVQLIGTSSWVARWIGQHPVILDELLDPIASAGLLDVDSIRDELARRLVRHAGDMEAQMDLLREFKNGYLLRVAALEIAGALDALAVRRALSDLAIAMLGEVVGVAEESLTARVRDQVAGVREQLMFGVVGYGKLGGCELSYSSDLDLVFLFDSDPPVDATLDATLGYYYSRLAQRIMHVLNTTTRAGVLYETDIRLRPSGRSGTMVSSIRAFDEYQHQQAWTWEHQALVRARMVTGPGTLADRFERVRSSILGKQRDVEALSQDVAEMRRRMTTANCRSTETLFDLKLGDGGIVDVEFIAQFHVLAEGARHPEILGPRGTIEILEVLGEAGVVSRADADGLADAYREYLARELELKLQEQPSLIDAGEIRDHREFVRARWRDRFGDT
ncbi:MAG: bifunctional [glutamate--ammonia ligase]-adenylyl-L-tyrosine phosphorylase/[glutamate--ammonia-ligase] adenylyltransferase, partial [Proteobacteria bacterium]